MHDQTLNIDLAPTLLELAGVRVPSTMQGRSLLPFIERRAPDPPWREDWLYEHRFALPSALRFVMGMKPIPKSEGIRTRRYKYLVHYDEEEPNRLLFDLETDPHEVQNIVAEVDPGVVAALDARLAALRARADAPNRR